MLIEMEISALAMDPTQNTPLVILKEKAGERRLPIWIGLLEAGAIAAKIEGVDYSRPMTHDLTFSIIEALGGRIDRIVVSDLVQSTFYARIYISADGRKFDFDSRPSDSIAMALRANAPIFVDSGVIQKSEKIDLPDGKVHVSDKEKMLEILENMDPEDFGKYKM
jgi:uncharacterized protein